LEGFSGKFCGEIFTHLLIVPAVSPTYDSELYLIIGPVILPTKLRKEDDSAKTAGRMQRLKTGWCGYLGS
jgi:hypothetical protein